MRGREWVGEVGALFALVLGFLFFAALLGGCCVHEGVPVDEAEGTWTIVSTEYLGLVDEAQDASGDSKFSAEEKDDRKKLVESFNRLIDKAKKKKEEND